MRNKSISLPQTRINSANGYKTPSRLTVDMNEIRFVDTTFRDGALSLWAAGIRTGMILPVAALMDQAGFEAIELIGSAFFKKCVRELKEDPWERIRLVSKEIIKTPLAAMMPARVSTFDLTPMCFVKAFAERLAANGIRRVQMVDPGNQMNFKMPDAVSFAKAAGLEVVLALVYSISPRHTDEHYAQVAQAAAKLKPDRIYLKDSGGLLTPDRVRSLIPAIVKSVGNIPVELHSHCTTTLAPFCYMEALKLGIKIIHTAIPPLANSSSQPSIFNTAHNARVLGFTPKLNEEVLKPVSEHF